MHCLVITEEIENIATELGEDPKVVASDIALWQEDNDKGIEDYPTVSELRSYIEYLRREAEITASYWEEVDKNHRELLKAMDEGYLDLEYVLDSYANNSINDLPIGVKISIESLIELNPRVFDYLTDLAGAKLQGIESEFIESLDSSQIPSDKEVGEFVNLWRKKVNEQKTFLTKVTDYQNNGGTENDKRKEEEIASEPSHESVQEELREEIREGVSLSESGIDSLINQQVQLLQDFTPAKLRNRASLVRRLFSQEVDVEMESHPGMERSEVITLVTPREIFSRIWDTFEGYVNSTEDERVEAELAAINAKLVKNPNKYTEEYKRQRATEKARYKTEEYKKILRNFQAIAEEASRALLVTEGVFVQPNSMGSSEVVDRMIDDETGESVEEYNNDEYSKEEVFKDGWMTKANQISSFSSLSKEIRRIISSIPRLNYKGKMEKDDLDQKITLDPMYVHTVLMDGLRGMVTVEDMIPLLTKMAETKPWVKSVINKITSDEVLFSKFYVDFRKDFVNYWIQYLDFDKDGHRVWKTKQVNRPESISYVLDRWRDNYESGYVLAENSVFDSNKNLNKENASKGLKWTINLTNKVKDMKSEDISKLTEEDSIIKSLNKLLNMIGIDTNPTSLASAIQANSGRISFILSKLNTIFSGISSPKFSEKSDLINEYSSAYQNLATILATLEEDAIESSFRENGNTYYSYVNPSYLSTLIKKFKQDGDKLQKFLDEEFRRYSWFFRDGEYFCDWLEQLATDKNARENFAHKVVLNFNKIEYSDLEDLDYLVALLNEYWSVPDNTKSNKRWAWYHVPVMADVDSAEFIKFRKYVDNLEMDEDGRRLTYQEIILPKLAKVVLQEYNRIQLVRERHTKRMAGDTSIVPIANFDIIGNKKGGSEFKFFPYLNTYEINGVNFLKGLESLIEGGSSQTDIENWIIYALHSNMEADFQKKVHEWEKMGLFILDTDGTYKYLPKKFNPNKPEEVMEALKEYHYNSTLATSQIYELTTTDLAFYSGPTNAQKRFKEIHGSGLKLNTQATYKGKRVGRDTERTIYLADNIIESSIYDSLKEALDARVKAGKLLASERDYILSKYKEVNQTDGQAYRSLDSYRAVMNMTGSWTDSMEESYQRLLNGEWVMDDFYTIWQPKKPFVYTQVAKESGNGELIKVPVQHKNSEFLLLANTVAGAVTKKSDKLRALNDFMQKYNIDVVQFESSVKVGGQGVINLNDVNSYEEVMDVLENTTGVTGVENPNVVHTVNYNDYSLQQEVPEHMVDATQLAGSQQKKLLLADLPSDFSVTLGDRSFNKMEIFQLLQSILTENIKDSYEKVRDLFENPKALEEFLIREISSSVKYSNDLKLGVSLDANGEPVIPWFDPVQGTLIQNLFTSIFKNNITKQKVKGGAAVQVTNWGMTDQLHIVFEGKGSEMRIKHIECFLPAYSKSFFEPFINPETGELKVDELPDNLRKIIGYRIPTENKYSILPLYIKGFLPQESGSCIMLPAEITTITGADFDIDKMFLLIPEFDSKTYVDKKRLLKDFQKTLPKGSKYSYDDLLIAYDEITNGTIEFSEDSMEMDLYDFISDNRGKYTVTKFEKVEYDFSKKPSENSVPQRNNLYLDLAWGVLTHPDTLSQILSPGNFDTLKKVTRAITILNNSPKEQLTKRLETKDKIFEKLMSLDLDELDSWAEEYEGNMNPLSPQTQVYFQQQNMTGANLIGEYANHNVNHALLQYTEVELNNNGKFTLNGKTLTSLHSIESEGRLISKDNSEFLAASVDNAKDPVLAGIVQNSFTAPIAMLLSRLGYSPAEIGVLFNQPIVKEISRKFFRGRREGKWRDTIIEEVLTDAKERAGIESHVSYETIANATFPIEELAENIVEHKNVSNMSETERRNFYRKQLMVGLLFQRLISPSDALSTLVRNMKADTTTGAAGPTIAATELKVQSVEDFNTQSAGKYFPLNGVDIVETEVEDPYSAPIPFIQAAFTYGIEGVSKLLKDYFPFYSDGVRAVVDTLRGRTKSGKLDVKTMNQIYNDLLAYVLSKSNMFNYKNREWYVKTFPKVFREILNKNKDIANLEFIKRLEVRTIKGIPTIIFNNVGRLTTDLKERYGTDWASLLYSGNPVARDLATQLLVYNIYRGGLAFGVNTFSHLAPVIVRLANSEYVDTLRRMLNSQDTYAEFVDQFILNHMDNRKLVPRIPEDSNAKVGKDGNLSISITERATTSDLKFVRDIHEGEVEFFEFVAYKVGKNLKYFMLVKDADNNAIYEEIHPLGRKNEYLEYEYGVPAIAVKSVFETQEEMTEEEDSPIDPEPSKPKEEERTPMIDNMVGQMFGEVEAPSPSILDLEPNLDYVDENGQKICGTPKK